MVLCPNDVSDAPAGHVMLPEHFDERIHLWLRIGDTGWVRRIVEQYRLRFLRNIRLDQFRCRNVARRRHVDELRHGPAQFDDRLVAEVSRGGDEHFITRVQDARRIPSIPSLP